MRSSWLHLAAVWAHVAAVVVWFGAVAYFPLVLRPAMDMAKLDRGARCRLLAAVKRRLRRVVGGAIAVLVVTGLYDAWWRGLLSTSGIAPLLAWKLVLGAVLIAIFALALPLLARVRSPARRGRGFIAVHLAVLTLGAIAAAVGVRLAR